jgi:anti-anti-sigma factor
MAVFLESPSHRIHVVTLTDNLRAPLTGELELALWKLVSGGERYVLLDLSAVSSIDAAGIGALVHAYNQVAAVDGVLGVVRVHARVQKMLTLVGLFDLLSAAAAT